MSNYHLSSPYLVGAVEHIQRVALSLSDDMIKREGPKPANSWNARILYNCRFILDKCDVILSDLKAATYRPSTDDWIKNIKADWKRAKEAGEMNDSHTAPICVRNVMELFARIEADRAELAEIAKQLGDLAIQCGEQKVEIGRLKGLLKEVADFFVVPATPEIKEPEQIKEKG